jgi:hypothetical protein
MLRPASSGSTGSLLASGFSPGPSVGGYAHDGGSLTKGEGPSVRVQDAHNESLLIKICVTNHSIVPLSGAALRTLPRSPVLVGEPLFLTNVAAPIKGHLRN